MYKFRVSFLREIKFFILDITKFINRSVIAPKELFDLAFTDEEKFKEVMLDLVKDGLPAGYAYSKLFVKYFTEKAAFRFGRLKGIRVVSVSPGVIDTPMTQNEASKRGAAYNDKKTR